VKAADEGCMLSERLYPISLVCRDSRHILIRVENTQLRPVRRRRIATIDQWPVALRRILPERQVKWGHQAAAYMLHKPWRTVPASMLFTFCLESQRIQ